MVCMDDVVDWFHKLSGAARVETMVTLLDICLPFEIRFLGTVMENLGRRDYHELRDVDHRANNFLHSTRNGTMNEKMALRSALVDTPMQLSSPCSNVNFTGPLPPAVYNNVVSNSQQTTNPSSSSEVSFASNRPSPNQHPDKLLGMRLSGGPNCQPPQLSDGHQFQGGRNQQSGENTGGGGDSGGNNKGCITLNIQNNENKEEMSDKSLLIDDVIRKRCILYISVLTATNRECANVYYQVLSEIKSLVEVTGWLEGIDDDTVEEMALLYTISSNHPAFTFDQRRNLSEYASKFLQMLSKSEPPKVTPTTQFITTTVQGLDQKYGQYYIQYVPHPMQWQNLSGTNGNVEEGNRLPNPVTFTMPPSYAFPMFMPTHHHHPRSQAPIHQVNPHQFSQNPLQPVQSTVSLPPPQAQMGMNNPNHPHPSQLVQHSYQQNPFGTVTVGSHLQPPPPSHVSHAYTQSMNGPVQNILPHAQLQAVGLQNSIPPIISPSISHPQYQQQQQSKAQPQQQNSQLSPQLPQPSPVVVGARTNAMSVTTGNPTTSNNNSGVVTTTFPSQSNSLDGNESEECVWDSPESSPFQSPPQSLTPSRSQSPSQPNQPHVITNQNQSCVAPHLNLSQPEMMMSHNSSSGSTVPTVCSSATSISPPPRSQKTSSSQKLSQNIKPRNLPKNAQDIEVSLNNVPSSSVPPVSLGNCMTGKQHVNCVVSANNLNGMKQTNQTIPDRRSKSSLVTVTNLMNNCSLNTSPIVTTATTSAVNVSQCPSLIQTTTCPSYPTTTNVAGGSQVSSRRQQTPTVRRQQQANNVTALPHHHSAQSTSVSSHYNLHSQPIKNTNIVSSTTSNQSQFPNFTFPFSIPQYSPHHQQQQPPPPSISTSKGINNSIMTAATKQITSQAPCNQNGSKINIISANDVPLFGGHSCSQQQPNSHIHNGIKLIPECATTFNMPVGLNLPTSTTQQLLKTSVVPPSQTSSRGSSRVLLEVGGGQDVDVLRRIDGTAFFGPLEDLVDPGSTNRVKMSCYNCGSHNHFGPDCKESTMEEMTKHPYRINFLPEPASLQDTKDTD